MTTKTWGYRGGDSNFEVLTVVTTIWSDSLGSNYAAYASHWFPQQLLMNIIVANHFSTVIRFAGICYGRFMAMCISLIW